MGETIKQLETQGMPCYITLSVNAGVSICIAGKKILVDAYHDKKSADFSTVTPEIYRRMNSTAAFMKPDLITCTHQHIDHYSPKMTEDALRRYPQAKFYLPDGEKERKLPAEGGEIYLDYFRLTHAGEEFRDFPNYGILLSFVAEEKSQTKNILLVGDAEVAGSELTDKLQGRTIDLALLNFPWMALGRGRDFVREVIRPKHLVLFHLPVEEDDRYGYQRALLRTIGRDETVKEDMRRRYAEKAAAACADIRVMRDPLTTELFYL